MNTFFDLDHNLYMLDYFQVAVEKRVVLEAY